METTTVKQFEELYQRAVGDADPDAWRVLRETVALRERLLNHIANDPSLSPAPMVSKLLLRPNPSTVEDLAQEIRFAVAHDIDHYDPAVAPLHAWIWGVARHLCAKHRAPRETPLDDSYDAPAPEEENPIDVAVQARLEMALAHLTDEEAEIIAKKYWLGVGSDADIAEQMNLSRRVVQSRRKTAERKLGRVLNVDLDGSDD